MHTSCKIEQWQLPIWISIIVANVESCVSILQIDLEYSKESWYLQIFTLEYLCHCQNLLHCIYYTLLLWHQIVIDHLLTWKIRQLFCAHVHSSLFIMFCKYLMSKLLNKEAQETYKNIPVAQGVSLHTCSAPAPQSRSLVRLFQLPGARCRKTQTINKENVKHPISFELIM